MTKISLVHVCMILLQTSACLIEGSCYEPGEYNPQNPREFCDPKVNYTIWQQADGEWIILKMEL